MGAKRQYCGRFGKVDNCQVGVFLGYAFHSYRTLIDKRLYLPEDWANDPNRREQCSVPDSVTFKTKAELGWEMLLNARKGDLLFAWVGMDCFYGQQPWFLDISEVLILHGSNSLRASLSQSKCGRSRKSFQMLHGVIFS